ncbi:hypothetical protein ABW21_db0208707 [Orbilia brochopaga]|nr:hypothetical protein ABW21_db0208707 [Drechslerella brochopaga]
MYGHIQSAVSGRSDWSSELAYGLNISWRGKLVFYPGLARYTALDALYVPHLVRKNKLLLEEVDQAVVDELIKVLEECWVLIFQAIQHEEEEVPSAAVAEVEAEVDEETVDKRMRKGMNILLEFSQAAHSVRSEVVGAAEAKAAQVGEMDLMRPQPVQESLEVAVDE